MELFRITRSEYQKDLSGEGAFKFGGRWNSGGNRMIYTSSRRSLAMLEILVHWHRPVPSSDFVVVLIFVPDTVSAAGPTDMIAIWRHEQQWCKDKGDSWLNENSSLLWRVPSVVVPEESNFLINPFHKDADSIKIVDV
jgi:RES domain-containing protein